MAKIPLATLVLPAGEKGDKGDKGDQGPQGLPGVNAVPADSAVATYLSNPTSASRGVLQDAVNDAIQPALTADPDEEGFFDITNQALIVEDPLDPGVFNVGGI